MRLSRSRIAVASLLACSTLIVGCRSDGAMREKSKKTGVAMMPAKPNAEMKAVLDHLAMLNGKPIETLSPEEARKQPTPTDAVRAIKKEQGLPTSPPPGVDTDDRKIEGVPVRVYTPSNRPDNAMLPTIVYIHGGGFVIATIDTYDATPRALAQGVNAVVVSVEYAKAPEHPFPASHEDVYKVTQWVFNHAADLKGDPKRVAIAGESAGGNMATGVCLMAKDRGGRMPVHQLLVYPVTDNDTNTPSYVENANAKPLNKAMMNWFFTKEATPEAAKSPYLLPLKNADVKGLPPATIVLAEIDPLRSEGKAYAAKLAAAGVDTQVKTYDGVTHEFFGMADVLKEAREAQVFAIGRLKASLK